MEILLKLFLIIDPGKQHFDRLVLPGWGQAYNKRYWEIPIVYGALGTAAGIYLYNNTWYKRTRDAYDIGYVADTANFATNSSKARTTIG